MWSSWTESAKASLHNALEKTSDALEKTGDVLTEAATHASRTARESKKKNAAAATTTTNVAPVVVTSDPVVKGRYAEQGTNSSSSSSLWDTKGLVKSFHTGWSSVVESTKATIKHAQDVVEEQQHKIQEKLSENIQARPKPRHSSLPIDVAALQDAHVVYLTDRIITLGHPNIDSDRDGDIHGDRKLAALAHLLHKRHSGHFMIWNLSEVDYDTSLFDNHVLNYSFPGSPCPPLGLLLKLLIDLESWLKADPHNVAVVHCLTGKGRTSTVVAAFLGWMAEAGFSQDIDDILAYIAQCKLLPNTDDLLIPSQRRYLSYFKNMLDGIRPSQPPLILRRIVLSHAPKFARGPGRTDVTWEDPLLWGCVPYIQLFKLGKLIFTAPASLNYQEQETTKNATREQESANPEANTKGPDMSLQVVPFCYVGDGTVSFHVNRIVQGDVLIRGRHLTAKQSRVSMFRAAFHTGYIGGNVLRLTKAQLDGACGDHNRFNDDFYMDIIFETMDSEEAATLIQQQQTINQENVCLPSEAAVHGTLSEQAQALAGGATNVAATDYDSMLDRDSRFWDVIAKRKQMQNNNAQKEGEKSAADKDGAPSSSADDANWGPTVGRRRTLALEQTKQENSSQKTESPESSDKTALSSAAAAFFSITGLEMDFMPQQEQQPVARVTAPKEKDSLMEALTGALDDDDGEVVFFHQGEGSEGGENPTPITATGDLKSGSNTLNKLDEPSQQVSAGDENVAQSNASPQPPVKPLDSGESSSKNDNNNTGDPSDSMDDMLDLDKDVSALLLASEAAGIESVEDVGNDDDDDKDLQDLENLLGTRK